MCHVTCVMTHVYCTTPLTNGQFCAIMTRSNTKNHVARELRDKEGLPQPKTTVERK